MTSLSPSQVQDHLQPFHGGVRGEGTWRDFHRYANVVRYQTYAGLKAEVSRTYLGVAWWLLEPTLAAVTMHIVFGLLLSSGSPSSAIARRAAFFPFLLGDPPCVPYLALPLIMLVQFGINLAVGVPLSIWIPYFRDGTTVIGALLGFLGMASGIFFRPNQVPPRYAAYVNFNPLANLLTAYRTILLDRQWPDWWALGRVALIAMILLSVGLAMMRRFDLKLTKVAI